MSENEEPIVPTLEFDQVSVKSSVEMEGVLTDLAFDLAPGKMLILRPESESHSTEIPALAAGLQDPDSGTVKYQGLEWPEVGPIRQCQLRSGIRRVFHGEGWISNLSTAENVVLSEMHHTSRPPKEIEEEAETLAREFGLDGLPSTNPAWVEPSILQRCEWVRAFIGAPVLIFLEVPMRGVSRKHQDSLISRATSSAASVVWLTSRASLIDAVSGDGVDLIKLS